MQRTISTVGYIISQLTLYHIRHFKPYICITLSLYLYHNSIPYQSSTVNRPQKWCPIILQNLRRILFCSILFLRFSEIIEFLWNEILWSGCSFSANWVSTKWIYQFLRTDFLRTGFLRTDFCELISANWFLRTDFCELISANWFSANWFSANLDSTKWISQFLRIEFLRNEFLNFCELRFYEWNFSVSASWDSTKWISVSANLFLQLNGKTWFWGLCRI